MMLLAALPLGAQSMGPATVPPPDFSSPPAKAAPAPAAPSPADLAAQPVDPRNPVTNSGSTSPPSTLKPGAGPPHIRLDRAAEFLIGDRV